MGGAYKAAGRPGGGAFAAATTMSDAGPVRRPRRSQEQRFQPFPRAGLLVHLQDVLVGEVRRPDFRPPPDEESSEEEEPVWTDDEEEDEGEEGGARRGDGEGDD
ncbi:hypothetical protein EG872_16450, partial [Enterococcus faecalis]